MDSSKAIGFSTDIKYLKGVGSKRAELYHKLGIDTVSALLHFYPREYEDWSRTVSIAEAPFDEKCCIKAIVGHDAAEYRIRKGMTLYKTSVTDGQSVMNITIFNNKYAAARLKTGEEFLFFGKVGGTFLRREMNSPLIAKAVSGEKIRPIYRQTEGISSTLTEKLMTQAVSCIKETMYDFLPEYIREKYELLPYGEALKKIHFPSSFEDVEKARKRLVFNELFTLQLGMIRLKGRNRQQTSCNIKKDYTDEFFSLLPFSPTGAQKRAVEDAVRDMFLSVPMSRLVQGDVGSGKTAVAAAVIYTAAKNSLQSSMMAPTEILARQHYKSLTDFFKGTDVKCGLLTGSMTKKEKDEVKAKLESGEIQVVVGTHALIQSNVKFKNLGLVITDEQHRFGVEQRSALAEKGKNPHTLVMSATPIPRTLALIIYGDLDISILDELPPGRQPVETYCVQGKLHKRVYNFIKKQLDEGRQAYAVCPLVEEGDTDLISAEEYAHKLSEGEFRDYTVGLIHGKMKPAQKDEVMEAFASGKIQLLVATTVIEVGVDVPNAAVMVIENAERFGLSQLHQLRGRIGRGKHKSTCILISDAQNPDTKERLKVMCQTCDGFKIADEDLRLRGPGDFFGSRQHGLPGLKLASTLTDTSFLAITRDAAQETWKWDPLLEKPEHSGIKKAVDALFKSAGENIFN